MTAGGLLIQGARIAGSEAELQDIEVRDGVIARLGPDLAVGSAMEVLDVGGRLVSAGLVETHIHLDKAMVIDQVDASGGTLAAAIQEVAALKLGFTPEDVHDRASAVLDKSIGHGTTRMRTHLELDPGVGLRSFEGVWPLVEEYSWALDLELCVFPQEGLLDNPGTDELLVAALRRGAHAVGGAPYTDSDPHGQIDRLFELAREFDVDVDLHLDFGASTDELDLFYVCDLAAKHSYGGRVTVGHVTKLAAVPPALHDRAARRLAEAGVALTVLPSTDLYLMGRDQPFDKVRGVTEAHRLLQEGVNCSLSTNNVLNPFTPLGDVSLLRMANLYANVAHVGSDHDFQECFEMISTRAARLLNLGDYGVAVGNPADLVVFDAPSRRDAVATVAPVLHAFKRGVRTVTRSPVELHRPLPEGSA
jgi:cytosine deaminase